MLCRGSLYSEALWAVFLVDVSSNDSCMASRNAAVNMKTDRVMDHQVADRYIFYFLLCRCGCSTAIKTKDS